MKILFMANAPWVNTGYGVQGKHLVPALKRAGHEVAYFTFYGLGGGVLDVGGTKIYPLAADPFGQDIVVGHMRDAGADTLITLFDAWATPKLGGMMRAAGLRWLPWTPVDLDPVSPRLLQAVAQAHTVLAYSRFGEEQLRAAGLNNVAYIPHGISAEYTPGDQAAARAAIGLPQDAFIIGMVAANKSNPARKAFPEQFAAFAEFARRHPDINPLLYVHTMWANVSAGIDVKELAKACGIADKVLFTDQYRYWTGLTEAEMANLYRSFDVLSAASYNEGFGIPILEAQACGIPVVTTAWTSMTELTWAGIAVGGQPWWEGNLESWACVPFISEITDAYETLLAKQRDAGERERLAAQATAGAEPYRWANLIDNYWLPTLAAIENNTEVQHG